MCAVQSHLGRGHAGLAVGGAHGGTGACLRAAPAARSCLAGGGSQHCLCLQALVRVCFPSPALGPAAPAEP